MCNFIEDEEKMEALMVNMLFYQKEWLPNFSESIPKYSELIKRKYFIEKKEKFWTIFEKKLLIYFIVINTD